MHDHQLNMSNVDGPHKLGGGLRTYLLLRAPDRELLMLQKNPGRDFQPAHYFIKCDDEASESAAMPQFALILALFPLGPKFKTINMTLLH